MVESGTPLAAGDVVMTGALGPMAPVSGGEVAEARIAGLGSVRVEFSRVRGEARRAVSGAPFEDQHSGLRT